MRKNNIIFPLILSLMFLIIALYGFMRNFPPGLNHDAACNGLHAIRILNGEPFKVYIPEDYGREIMFHYSLAVFFTILGISRYTIEVAGIFFGLLSVPIIYYLFFELSQDSFLSFLGGFFWITSSALIVYSRSGWRLITLIPGVVSVAFFATKHYKKNNLISAVGLGASSAYILYTYNGGRGIVFFLPLFLLVTLIKNRLKKESIYNTLILILIFLIISGPIFWYAINNYQIFMGRASSLSDLSSFKDLMNNVLTSFLFFNYQANGDDFLTNFSVLEGPARYLWIFGLFYSFYKLKKYWHFVLLFIIFLMPSFFVVPSFHRSVGTLPLIYVFVFLALLSINQLLKKRRFQYIKYIVFILLIFLQIFYSLNKLYVKKTPFIWGFYPETTIVGKFIRDSYYKDVVVYASNWPEHSLHFNSIRDSRAILPKVPLDKIDSYVRNYQSYNTRSQDGIEEILFDLKNNKINKSSFFIVSVDKDTKFREKLQENSITFQLISEIKDQTSKQIALIYSLLD